MSLKPPKKSDANKSWMKKPDRQIKIQPEYHLLVTEGTDTEPAYFGAIRDIINKQYPKKIQLDVSGAGDNTINLFEKARVLAKHCPNVYRHVWVVYDTDDFPAEHIDRVVQLCNENSTEETEYHAIWSNQCIELWFLLHFGFMQSDIHRTEYWPKLTDWLKKIGEGEYKKNRQDMYWILRPFMELAITNAKRLDRINVGRAPSKAAPGTKVYELVERLKPYL
nr:RloB domain-containing protein [Eubacterium sp.]